MKEQPMIILNKKLKKKKVNQKNCAYCGRFFKPHPRVGNRQKSCGRPTCNKKRKKESQQKWCAKNLDYFKDRSDEIAIWRKKNPGYQSLWRKARSEIQDLVSEVIGFKSIPSKRRVVFVKNEIQDLVVHVTLMISKGYDTMEQDVRYKIR